MRWAVEIESTGLEKRNLEDLLQGLGFDLIEGVKYLAFTSPEIENCGSAPEVYEKAKLVRDAFIGAANIDHDFALGAVIDYSSQVPIRHVFAEASAGAMATASAVGEAIISPPSGLSENELEQWKAYRKEEEYQARLESQHSRLIPAYTNVNAAKMMELLATKNFSSETLYRIYELAEGHPDNRKSFHAQFGITWDEFNRFRDAVHNPAVTGDWARHAYHDTPRTSNPMTKGEAESFVRKIANQWLQSLV
ncbi:hypothetical protein [Methylobacillus sp. MM3]|uniref:hypothetical protein n=1 Tax=Methylobacillus sp. MM3 TaxID=1848039 RepID=UPI0010422A42|nr:hypothetical protein [Methylobacillus sp. MM3]